MNKALQILNKEIAIEEKKMLLETVVETKSHNGLSYGMVNAKVALRAMQEYADQFKPKPKKEVKRYFSASYQGFYNDGSIRGGNVHFDCNTYPPRWWIEDKIKELDPGIYRAMILSIQEMTKEDYESFISKEN